MEIPTVNIGRHVESVSFMLLLHKQFEFHLKVRCTAWQVFLRIV